jgi:hypothetical protein
MTEHRRTELQQEVVQALLESKAVDFEALGAVFAKYGELVAREGSGLSVQLDWRFVHDTCIPPEPYAQRRFGLEATQE